jgi:hypothetical protein
LVAVGGAIAFFLLVIVIVIATFNRLGDDGVPPANAVPPVAGQPEPPTTDEVPWSDTITVKAGKWSKPIWSPGPKKCFDVILLEGAPNTPAAFRRHSMLLPWEAEGKNRDWIPNSGEDFKAIKLGGANKILTFMYRFLPKCRPS